jgi:uncharacterized protein (DUF1778 family)
MKTEHVSAEVNIHLRARAYDRELIDRAAGLLGSNRSQFMMASALKEAKNVILDQSSFHVDNKIFNKILDLFDTDATQEQLDGMKRLLTAQAPWSRE